MTVVYLDRVFPAQQRGRLSAFPMCRKALRLSTASKAADFLRGAGRRLRGCGLYFRACILAHPAIRLAFGGLLALAAFRRFRPVLTFFCFRPPSPAPAGPRPGLWLGGGTGTAVVLRRC